MRCSELISDTGWPGYEQVPRWIVEGYATIFDEVDEQLPPGVQVDGWQHASTSR